MTTMYGGTASQGTPIGILMADSVIARIPGDVGNGFTYDFPVRFHTVKGATAARMIESTDYSLLQDFIDGAQLLVDQGCKAITTSCGFLIAFQEQLAAAIDVPVFTSALMQAPFVAQILPPKQKIGILTANKKTLDPKHFLGYGLSEDRIVIYGMEETEHFYKAFPGGSVSYVYEDVEADMLMVANKLVAENPDVGAIVCEGTNMSPFSPAMSRATGLPVFDIITMTRWVASGVLRGMTSSFRNRLTGGETTVPPQWGRPPKSV